MAKSIRDFEGLYAKGELGKKPDRDSPYASIDGPSFPGMMSDDPARYGPPADGFVAQTVNGTARATGTGWNQENWDFTEPQRMPGPTNPKGRNNRTGE